MNKSESKYFNTAIRFDKALLSLLEKKSFEYITISEICDRAGVNRSTFYLHYENVNDLLKESIQYVVDDFCSSFPSTSINNFGYVLILYVLALISLRTLSKSSILYSV